MRRVWVLWLILLSGCASIPPARPPVFPADELARADARVAEGCLSCLIEARDTFVRLADGPFRADILPPLFATQLLLVLRHKELAMATDAPLAEARRTASELGDDWSAERYFSLVEAVSEDPAGATERQRGAFARAHESFKARLTAEASWADQGPLGRRLGRYLSTAVQCSYDPTPVLASRAKTAADVPPDEDPLLTFRRGICDEPNLPELDVVLARVPEFHEALYYSARGWLNDAPKYGFGKAAAAVLEVLPRFSQSSSVSFTAAGIQRVVGRCPEALDLYDQTLTLRPGHESAVLGRTECLSRLKRHEAAISEATILIGLGGRNLPMAYYWRAWNEHTLARLPAARQDIDSAKRAQREPDINIPLLAGVIEHDQDDLDQAMTDLKGALAISRGRACLADWYVALVNVKRSNWGETSVWFENAMRCYDQNVRESQNELALLAAHPEIAEDYKAVRVKALNEAMLEDDLHKHNAAINAAKAFATVDNFEAAVRLGAIASEFASLAPEVQVLRDYLVARKSPVQLPDPVAAPPR